MYCFGQGVGDTVGRGVGLLFPGIEEDGIGGGDKVGSSVVGSGVGSLVGSAVGALVGDDGRGVGLMFTGTEEDGDKVGGSVVGSGVGLLVGSAVGALVGGDGLSLVGNGLAKGSIQAQVRRKLPRDSGQTRQLHVIKKVPMSSAQNSSNPKLDKKSPMHSSHPCRAPEVAEARQSLNWVDQ